MVEFLPSKQNVASSSLVFRSMCFVHVAQQDSAMGFYPIGWEFKSLHGRQL